MPTFQREFGAQINLSIGAVAIGFCLALTSCSDSTGSNSSNSTGKPDFFESATDLESSLYNGCIQYKFASQYLKLILENKASDNEVFYMASQMDEAADVFFNAGRIDEAEGGFQYRRYKNYSYFASGIADIASRGINWRPSDSVAHREILEWCSDWSVQIDNRYDGVNAWSPEVAELQDGQRKP